MYSVQETWGFVGINVLVYIMRGVEGSEGLVYSGSVGIYVSKSGGARWGQIRKYPLADVLVVAT